MFQVLGADTLERLLNAIHHEPEVVDPGGLVRLAAVPAVGPHDLGLVRADLEQRQIERAVHHHVGVARGRAVALLEAEGLLVELLESLGVLDHEGNVPDLRHGFLLAYVSIVTVLDVYATVE